MESTKLVLGSVRYKINPHSIQSRHRSAICSTNCGPSSRESNLSFWLDHQCLFLSSSQPPLVIWTSAGPAKATTPSLRMKTTGTCDQREPGESFTVQMLPVCCMLRSHSHCFPAQSSGWAAHTNTRNTSLFNTAPGEAWNGKMLVWRKEWNKMHDWKTCTQTFISKLRERKGEMICWPKASKLLRSNTSICIYLEWEMWRGLWGILGLFSSCLMLFSPLYLGRIAAWVELGIQHTWLEF